jgi:hypothetical protein
LQRKTCVSGALREGYMKGKAKFKGKAVQHAESNGAKSNGYRGGNAHAPSAKYGSTSNQTRAKKTGFSREH